MKRILIACIVIAVSAILFCKSGEMISNPFETKVVSADYSDDFREKCQKWYEMSGINIGSGGSPEDSGSDNGTHSNQCGRGQGPCNAVEIVRYTYTGEPWYECRYTGCRADFCSSGLVSYLNSMSDK